MAGMSQSDSTGAPAGTRPRVSSRPRIIVLGGGYVGLYTAMRLLRKLHKREADITVVDPRSYMTYQPFLPEASAGSLDARHVVVPLRKVLKGAEILNARVVVARPLPPGRAGDAAGGPGVRRALRHRRRRARLDRAHAADPRPGRARPSASRRSRRRSTCATRCSRASTSPSRTADEARRKRALTFVFVGGGYAGVEAMAELEDMARFATRYYTRVSAERPAVRDGRGDRPDPARGRRGHGPVDGRAAAQARHRDGARAPG